MEALVVFESLYGNTARIARAVGDGLAERGLPPQVVGVDAVEREALASAELLVVGGPTHAHGMSRSSSRTAAATDERNTFEAPTTSAGVRELLATLPAGSGRASAAFDTRVGEAPAFLTGAASKRIARGLEDRGFRLVAKPESFLVTRHNELVDGEIDHAVRWGAGVAEAVSALR
jgi:hypothetical protein